MKKNKGLIIVLAVIVLIIAMIVPKYNKLVALDNDVDAAYSQVQIVVKRRADLIPNLGFSTHGSLHL